LALFIFWTRKRRCELFQLSRTSDRVMWFYGSGFGRAHKFTGWMRSMGLKSSEIDCITGTNMGGHYTTAATQPAVRVTKIEKANPRRLSPPPRDRGRSLHQSAMSGGTGSSPILVKATGVSVEMRRRVVTQQH
jgi:hypothetical protein